VTQPIEPIPAAPSPAGNTRPAPQPVPRPLTPLAQRRAWTEPRVRIWWLLAVVFFVLTLVLLLDRIWVHGDENRLITDGKLVEAKVIESNGITMNTKQMPPESPVTLEFDWNGQTQQVTGTLEDRTEYIVIGKTLPIRVAPDDPQNWTYRSVPSPLLHELIMVFVLLPLSPLFALIAARKHRTYLQTWHHGEAALGVVTERRQSPIAPMSYAIRCNLRDRGDKRIFTVFVPPAGRSLRASDPIWLILPLRTGKKNRPPVATMWFE